MEILSSGSLWGIRRDSRQGRRPRPELQSRLRSPRRRPRCLIRQEGGIGTATPSASGIRPLGGGPANRCQVGPALCEWRSPEPGTDLPAAARTLPTPGGGRRPGDAHPAPSRPFPAPLALPGLASPLRRAEAEPSHRSDPKRAARSGRRRSISVPKKGVRAPLPGRRGRVAAEEHTGLHPAALTRTLPWTRGPRGGARRRRAVARSGAGRGAP